MAFLIAQQNVIISKIEKIEEISNSLLEQTDYSGKMVNLENICDYMLKNYNLLVVFEDIQNNIGEKEVILGKISFDPPIIRIAKNPLGNMHRLRFTLAHEIGHFILGHGNFLKHETYSTKDIDQFFSNSIDLKVLQILEWQANQFASSLLLPRQIFMKAFYQALVKYDIRPKGKGLLYVDDQECNQHNFYNVTEDLKRLFQVSREAIKLRAKKLNLVTGKI